MKDTKNQNYALYDVTPVASIRNLLDTAKSEAGEKIAFRYRVSGDEIRDITYNTFTDTVDAIGTYLEHSGLGSEHIAQVGENSYRWVTVYLAAIAGSAVYVPVDKDLPEADIINVINHSDSRVLFYSKKYDDIVRRSKDTFFKGIKLFVRINNRDDEAGLEGNITAEYSDSRFHSYTEIVRAGRELLDGGYTDYLTAHSGENELKMIVYTSGTTGMSKGVMLSEHNLVSLVYNGLKVSTVYDTFLSVLPYHHTYEAVAGLLVSLHHHSTICINESLKAVMKNFLTYKPDYVYLVPAFAEEFYKRIWANARKTGKEEGLRSLIKMSKKLRSVGIDARKKLFATIHENFGGNLVKIVCGGAPIRPEIGEFFDDIGINLVNGYGITECSPLVSANRDMFNDWTTVGCPLPCVEIKLEDVTPEGIGEICVKGDTVMLGYYKQPEVTAEVLSPDGWFSTGDYGIINECGQLVITGRKKNIIVLSNGKNVYPEEIENYIQNIPYVKEVVVYGMKNEFGEEYKLCAEVFPDADKMSEMNITDAAEALRTDITKACSSLPVYKNIGKIVIRSKEFDKTTTNKIKRQSITVEEN